MSNWGSGYITGLTIGLIIGLVIDHHHKFKPWRELSKKEKKIKIATIIIGSLMVLIGIIFLFLMKGNIAK